MSNVHDVAAYILTRLGRMTAMKLQKLVYYCQAWSLVWDEARLFPEPIGAWANGPVVRALYEAHRGEFEIGPEWPLGRVASLSEAQVDTINRVLEFYGSKGAHWLSDLSHREEPWKRAREGLPPGVRGNREIGVAEMADYYSGLFPA